MGIYTQLGQNYLVAIGLFFRRKRSEEMLGYAGEDSVIIQ